MGKSTLFAALQAVLFERHRSQAQTVRSFQPAGHEGAAPRVALEFELDGQRYRIEKRFLRRPSAELAPARRPPAARRAGRGGARSAARRRGCRPPQRAAKRRALESALGRPGPLVRAARDRRRRPRRTAVGARPRARRGAGGEQGARADRQAIDAGAARADLQARRPAGRYKEADEARQLAQEVARAGGRSAPSSSAISTRWTKPEPSTSACASRPPRRAARRPELAELAARRDRCKMQHAELREADAALQATLRHDLAQTRPSWRAARHCARRLAAAEARARRGDRGGEAELADGRGGRRGGWPPSRRPRWSACRRRLDAAENHRRSLQRLAQAIRQRDDGRAALRAAASEVAPRARAGARVGGCGWPASRSISPPFAAHRRPVEDRDRRRRPHPGPPGGRRTAGACRAA